MTIGFTGTRQGMSETQVSQVLRVLDSLSFTSVLHGGARGADQQFAALLLQWPSLPVTVYRAGANPLVRNRRIVAECDLLIAAPLTNQEEVRSGTWATVRYARTAGKPVLMLSR